MVNTMSTPANTATARISVPLEIPTAEDYFERTIYGVPEHDTLDYARANQEAVLLTGPAGTGKTSTTRAYAHKHNLPYVFLDVDQQTVDKSVITGQWVPVGLHEMAWQYGDIATAIQQPSVVLINELSRMPAKGASIFLTLLQERVLKIKELGEIIHVHPDCLLIADQNVGSEYSGTSRQDKALMDRFNVKLEFDYDRAIEEKFIESPTLLDFAVSIREAREISDEFSTAVSTRMLKNFQAQARGLSFEFATQSLLNNFPKDDGEREAIQQRFDINRSRIASELGVELGNYGN